MSLLHLRVWLCQDSSQSPRYSNSFKLLRWCHLPLQLLNKHRPSKVRLTSWVSRPWIIDLRAFDHKTNSSILSAFDSTSPFPMIILVDGSISIFECIHTTEATPLWHYLLFFTCPKFSFNLSFIRLTDPLNFYVMFFHDRNNRMIGPGA